MCRDVSLWHWRLGLKANFVGLGLWNIRLCACILGLERPGLGTNYKAKIVENGA